jgi:PAS domain-containing protein
MVLAMLSVAALLIPVVLISVFYIRSLNATASRIVNEGIELVEAGNRIPLEFARARRSYENFARAGDSADYWVAQAALSRIGVLIARSRLIEPALAPHLDSVARCIAGFRILAGLEFGRAQQRGIEPQPDSARFEPPTVGSTLLEEPGPRSALSPAAEARLREINVAIVARSDSALGIAQQLIDRHRRRGQQLSAWGQRNIITALLITIALLAWLVTALPRRAVLPVKRIANALRRAEGGDLSGRISVTGNDEIASLARRLNRLFARLREFDDRKSERIQLLERRFRTLANDISEGVILFDRTPKILFANAPMEHFLGTRAADAAGHALEEFPRLAFLADALEETLAGASGHQECDILPGLPGAAVCIEAMRDASGSVAGALVVMLNPAAEPPADDEPPPDSSPAQDPPATT